MPPKIKFVILFLFVFFIFIRGSMGQDDGTPPETKNTEKVPKIVIIPSMFKEKEIGISSKMVNRQTEDSEHPNIPIQKTDGSPPVILTRQGGQGVSVLKSSLKKPTINQTENNWQTQAGIDISKQGMIETYLPPGLHRCNGLSQAMMNQPLDLCLLGPEGKPRAFEIFWRRKGKTETLELEASSIELWDDRRLVWEGTINEKLRIKRVRITLSDNSYVGKVDVQGQDSSGWKWLSKNAALFKTEKSNQVTVKVREGEYSKLRLYFSGYDREYQDTPIFINNVQVEGEHAGEDYIVNVFSPPIEELRDDQILEIRAALPGSGIWIDEIEITTSAMFRGKWSMGLEAIVMGKQDYNRLKTGTVPFINKEGNSFSIKIGQQLQGRSLILRLESPDYFGEIEDFKVKARLPRMLFFADKEGIYTARTGWGNTAHILEKTGDDERSPDQIRQFSEVEINQLWQPESLAEDYNMKGGPFDKKGFTWKALVHTNKPGFYRLKLNEKAILESNVSGLRLVKDDIQVPYFFGRKEMRDTELETGIDYDDKNNRSVINLKLPFASSQWLYLRFTSHGIFKRTLFFEKHEPGKAGWQPWLKRDWVSDENDKSMFEIDLKNFPSDQTEIRVHINHGDNEPITINSIHGLFWAHDLLFLASKAGDYELMGGNPTARAASYDLSIVQDDLFSFIPEQIEMGTIETLRVSEEIKNIAAQGGPFDSGGYTWISNLTVDNPGFYRLILNQRASLDKNRAGLRLVKNGFQVPYFIGHISKRESTPEFESEYIKKGNKTVISIKLPYESPHWHSIQLASKGIFDRDLVLEVPKPGKTGWKPWKNINWSNHNKGDAKIDIKLVDFPTGVRDLRITIEHGDNHPMDINEVRAIYLTQDLFFLAGASGKYELAGGNPSAPAASYDLELLQNHLLKSEPIKLEMKEIESFKSSNWETRFNEIFSEQGWGLYAVLGAVTLILLILIVKLFPKERGD